MSHRMQIEVELHDKQALEAACKRVDAKLLDNKTYKFHSFSESGLGIQLNGWRYPVVVNEVGKASYDNYNGAWGNIDKLHELEAYYGIEKTKIEATNNGYAYEESVNSESMPQLEILFQ